jgi:hypothetical protein
MPGRQDLEGARMILGIDIGTHGAVALLTPDGALGEIHERASVL